MAYGSIEFTMDATGQLACVRGFHPDHTRLAPFLMRHRWVAMMSPLPVKTGIGEGEVYPCAYDDCETKKNCVVRTSLLKTYSWLAPILNRAPS